MISDRDRLIELISQKQQYGIATEEPPEAIYTIENHQLADYLLANGVIVPPCKVGDTVYYIAGKKVYKSKCHAISQHKGGLQIHLYDYDGDNARYTAKDVFLTKSQAEVALKNEQEKL
jgi:hypothetical protein